MSEPVGTVAEVETSDYIEEDELPTNRLNSGRLGTFEVAGGAEDRAGSELDTVDWLSRLSTGPASTGVLPDNPPPPQPQPSGMGDHAAPLQMRPTLLARLTTGLRRGTLLTALLLIAAGAIAAGAYGLASTSWLSVLVDPPATVSQPSSPDIGQKSGTQGSPNSGAQSANLPPAISRDARSIRDQGVAEYRAGNLERAAALFEHSLLLSSNDAVTHYQLGLTYLGLPGRPHALDDAEMAFRTAASLHPGWAAPHQGLAESMIRRGYFDLAVESALTATTLDPTAAEAWMTLGRAYDGAGNKAEATRAYAQASRHAPPPPLQP